jgi:hypothetical protein
MRPFITSAEAQTSCSLATAPTAIGAQKTIRYQPIARSPRRYSIDFSL